MIVARTSSTLPLGAVGAGATYTAVGTGVAMTVGSGVGSMVGSGVGVGVGVASTATTFACIATGGFTGSITVEARAIGAWGSGAGGKISRGPTTLVRRAKANSRLATRKHGSEVMRE